MARTSLDTSEIWYEMQCKVSHLPDDEAKEKLEDAISDLVARWENKYGETW